MDGAPIRFQCDCDQEVAAFDFLRENILNTGLPSAH